MALLQISSPHAIGQNRTQKVMIDLLLALLPGIIISTWFYGWGTLLNIVLAVVLSLIIESLVAVIRQRPLRFYISDGSGIVTAVLLALTVPPFTAWWALLIGMIFALGIAKHLYGGLGYNPFNPAMVGYVVLLISFPLQMTFWPSPQPLLEVGSLNLLESIKLVFELSSYPNYLPDAYSSATALDVVKQNQGFTMSQLYTQQPLFAEGQWAALGTEWVNIGFLAGGLYLLYRRTFTWHGPLGMLAVLGFCALLGYDGGSSASNGSMLFHWLSGATMLGAFFIVTDPVSGATSNLGRFIFGAMVGLITYVIRVWGNYPDGVAFGVLLMNFAAPFIDYYTQPRSYGHDKRKQSKLTK